MPTECAGCTYEDPIVVGHLVAQWAEDRLACALATDQLEERDCDIWAQHAHTLLFALEGDQRLERLLTDDQVASVAASHLYQSVVFTARERSTVVARFLTYPALVGGLIHRRCQDRTWDSSRGALDIVLLPSRSPVGRKE